MSIRVDGRVGETWAMRWLAARGLSVFQADWIARSPEGVYFVVEVKHQEAFTPPPFYGHGLPYRQVTARLRFQEETGIRAILLVREKGSDESYWQFFDALEDGPHFDTNGLHPRRVYPLESFNRGTP